MSSESINHRVSGSRRLRRGARRPATVLVFVMALLGILFVMGISFVTLTQFESRAIDSERERSLSRQSADGLFQEMGRVLQEGLGGPFSLSGAGDQRVAFAEMPGVHNTFSPIEPYWVDPGLDPKLVFGGLTDLEAVADGDQTGGNLRDLLPGGLLRTDYQNGYPDIPNGVLPADADGDGVVDSLAVDVRKLKLFSNSQMSVLAPALNADSNPAGAVYLAVRILPHGGLVDLNHAHPSLIKEALNVVDFKGVNPNDPDPKGTIYHRPSQEHIGYTPALEEVGLRRRNLLPARSLAPSALMGNPFLDPDSFTYGDADMHTILLSPGPLGGLMTYQTVYEDNHRYWPIDPLEPFYPGVREGPSLWEVRMEPDASYQEDPSFDQYDQRHLVTTISHDDLLSRGVDVAISDGNPNAPPKVRARDLMDMMATANFVLWDNDIDECRKGANSFSPIVYTNSSWFELPDYPHTLPNGYDSDGSPMDWCECVDSDSECRLNARKGRLRLSLPWLDEAIDPLTGVFAEPHRMERAHRLVQEVFTMLLLNARNTSTGGATKIWGKEQLLPPPNPDNETFWVPDTDAISFAAASLTANLFDYMDDDDTPTRVRLRSSGFSPSACDSSNPCNQNPAFDEGECLADGFCERDPTAGSPLNNLGVPHYAYGIEAQPYITEIATVTADVDAPLPGALIGFGIELYNPHSGTPDSPDGVFLNKYSIMAFDPAVSSINGSWGDDRYRIRLSGFAAPSRFTVFRAGTSGLLPQLGPRVVDVQGRNPNVPVTFIQTGFHVYLIREVDLDGDPTNPDDRIVLDEFVIDGRQLGVHNEDPGSEELRSTERANVDIDEDLSIPAGPWFAPVPALPIASNEDNVLGGSLGKFNNTIDPDTAMVEAAVGNAGTFARAFPTTGSMLMVMRYANRDSTQYELVGGGEPVPLAFIAYLDDVVQVLKGSPPSLVGVPAREQVDNGRMPVFDIEGAHRLPASGTAQNQPGDLQRLPWGQLVFDYFTALPLSNLGPYEFNGDSGLGACCQGSSCLDVSGESECDDAGGIFAGPGTVCADVACGVLRDQPKVDLDGLRVHGRININAAPWKVLAGLPMMRAAAFDFLADPNNPADTQEKLVAALGLLGAEAKPIGEQVAMAIVAYRELRGLSGLTGGGTGNYDDTRGWNLVPPNPPSQRRGSGFMSVGELANVRNSPDPVNADFQIFPGGLPPVQIEKDFVRYASRLIAMGDWMTARSHVFTVYGLLLGDEDQTITVPGDETEEQKLRTEDVLSRAVRFQETVDRLGTFTGDPLPRRIGERVLVGYTDTQND